MRLPLIIVLTVLGWRFPSGICGVVGSEMQRRQDTTDTDFPSLTTDSQSQSTDVPSDSSSVASVSATSTQDVQSSTLEPSPTPVESSAPLQSSTAKHSSSTVSPFPSASSAAANNSTTGSSDKDTEQLPLKSKITPAFGITGVFLIVLGGIYGLIGVKSRWVQIFLSCAFLASIATTALVDYVMNPPVTDAVQGGFFVAIFMTGAVFGGGALIFKEYTEGFGCLLGGFCFSMWLLTLRSGGLITSSGGKGAFIGILCVVTWALSWFEITRPYGLIGSTSFSGATAFTLGIDCFTRAGMKEFWFYIWNLNDNLFPLNTNTYPLTRGIRVEIAVIVIGTIIGVLSQMKLWKMIRSKQRETEVVTEEDIRQKEALEAALGRHLQRQNEREKSEWEKQYGDRLQSKRNTILWQDAHPEKRHSTVSVVEFQPIPPSSSSASLEMSAFGPKRPSVAYGSKNKRQSSVTVDVIEEVEEDPEAIPFNERQKALEALEDGNPLEEGKRSGESNGGPNTRSTLNDRALQGISGSHIGKSHDTSRLKRQSQQSLSGRSKQLSGKYGGASESQERLIEVERPYSRASSAAATMDEDNEDLNIGMLDIDTDPQVLSPPEIVISPVDGAHERELGALEGVNQGSVDKEGSVSTVVAMNSEHPALPAELDQSSSTGIPPNSNEIATARGSELKEETPEIHKSPSQASEVSNSSVDSLTQTALAQVPSQLSSVVLSYRTNEWAKHIATAEAPIFEEPETIDGADEELPTQLAAPTPESDKAAPANEAAVEVPPAEPLPPTVKAGGSGVGIAAHPAAAQRSFSDQERRQSVARPAPPAPSRSASTQSLKNTGKRGSRSALNAVSATSLVATPIEENVPTEFNNAKRTSRRSSGGSPYMMPQRSSSGSLLSMSGMRPYTSHGSATPYTGSSYDLAQLTRPSSQQTQRPSLNTGTRLDHRTSHQPPRRDLRTDAEKRESLLAEWRLSQQRQSTSSGLNGASAEAGRAQMRAHKENQKLMEEYQRNAEQQKQYAMDQVMRRPAMQDLHREAMRKLQANANQKLGTSTD